MIFEVKNELSIIVQHFLKQILMQSLIYDPIRKL